MSNASCVFCRIIAGEIQAATVYEDENTIVFLDNSPLFPGHCLVCPREHIETLPEIPQHLLTPLFGTAQIVSQAIERAFGAGGSLLAVNNKISQSVPHLHVHIIPRNRGDGLKGFFWPRRPYRDAGHLDETRQALAAAITYLRQNQNV